MFSSRKSQYFAVILITVLIQLSYAENLYHELYIHYLCRFLEKQIEKNELSNRLNAFKIHTNDFLNRTNDFLNHTNEFLNCTNDFLNRLKDLKNRSNNLRIVQTNLFIPIRRRTVFLKKK